MKVQEWFNLQAWLYQGYVSFSLWSSWLCPFGWLGFIEAWFSRWWQNSCNSSRLHILIPHHREQERELSCPTSPPDIQQESHTSLWSGQPEPVTVAWRTLRSHWLRPGFLPIPEQITVARRMRVCWLVYGSGRGISFPKQTWLPRVREGCSGGWKATTLSTSPGSWSLVLDIIWAGGHGL